MITILLFIGVLSLLILIHEGGHLLVAKTFNVWVHQFAIGFGPDLFSFKRNETVYSFKPILVGGYVKLAGEDAATEDEDEEQVPEDRKLYSQTPLVKSAIAAAGPLTNILFAIILTVFIVGLTGVPKISIYGILDDSPSQGIIKRGDIIQSIQGKTIHSTGQINTILQENGEKEIKIKLERNGNTLDVRLKPKWYEEEGRYMIGVSLGPSASTKIEDLAENSYLAKRGLEKGDSIGLINGEEMNRWSEALQYLSRHQGEKTELLIEKKGGGSEIITIPEGTKTETIVTGLVPHIFRKSPGPLTSVQLGLKQIKTILITTYQGLKMVFSGEIAAEKAVSGPVGIASYLGQGLERGPSILFNLIALISLNLGLVNLVPFPALDGSRIGFAFYEMIVGKPIPPEKENLIHTVGFLILIGLIIFLTYHDIMRIFQ